MLCAVWLIEAFMVSLRFAWRQISKERLTWADLFFGPSSAHDATTAPGKGRDELKL